MKTSDELRRENEALRERISRLNAAVLNEFVESARALTESRYGITTTIDASGQVQDFVTSGFTDEEERQIAS